MSGERGTPAHLIATRKEKMMSSTTIPPTAKIAELEQRIIDLERRLERLENDQRPKAGVVLAAKPRGGWTNE